MNILDILYASFWQVVSAILALITAIATFVSWLLPNLKSSTKILITIVGVVLMVILISLIIIYFPEQQAKKSSSERPASTSPQGYITATSTPSTALDATPTASSNPSSQGTTLASTPVIPTSTPHSIDNSAGFSDTFIDASNPHQWDLIRANGTVCTIDTSSHSYQMTTDTGTGGSVCREKTTQFTNFKYQITEIIRQGTEAQQGGTGPVFCITGNGDYYVLTLNIQGYWVFGVRSNAVYTELKKGQSTSFLPEWDQANTITITRQGSNIKAEINGAEIFSINNTQLTGGYIGVGTSPVKAGYSGTQVRYDDINVSSL